MAYDQKLADAETRVAALEEAVRQCWSYLFDDDGSPVAPQDVRQSIVDLEVPNLRDSA